MNSSLTICDFLEQGGAQVTIFDMGRRVVEIPLDTIRRFEHTEEAYPYPFLRSAWLGILFHYPDKGNGPGDAETNQGSHNIWFIKLPLDEQGLLQQASRDDFLHRMLETMADAVGNNPQQQSIDDNPHGFKPREDKMAVFHAKISKQLGEPPSQFYNHARDYFSGNTGFDQWNFVGLQGIADVAARLDEDNNAQILANAMAHLPTIPFAALCSCLENTVIDEALTREIGKRISKALDIKDATVVATGIRGLSNSADQEMTCSVLHTVLTNPVGQNVEVLAAIAGRCWFALENAELRLLFLESLALCEAGQQAFDSILADLLFLPGLRQLIKEDFKNPGRSEQLTNCIEAFLLSVQTTTTT